MEMMSELLWFCKGGIGGSGASTLHALCPNCVTEQGQPQGSPCQGSSAGLSAYQERGAGQVLLRRCVAVVGVIPPDVAGCVLLWGKGDGDVLVPPHCILVGAVDLTLPGHSELSLLHRGLQWGHQSDRDVMYDVGPSTMGHLHPHLQTQHQGVSPGWTPPYLVHQELSEEQEAVASPGGHGDGEFDGHPLHGEEAQVLQLKGQRVGMRDGR